jgi:EXLDI family protein
MPNKTIYIADQDLDLFERAQQRAGTSLSAIIVEALRRYLAQEEARTQGFEDVKHLVGSPGSRRTVQFQGRLLAKWRQAAGDAIESVRVYQTRRGQFAVYRSRQPNWSNWEDDWDHYPWPDEHLRERRLDVYPDQAALAQAIPADFLAAIDAAASGQTNEYLDI